MLIATHSPEIIDKEVEDAQEHDQHDGASLCLETDNNHDARNGANENDQDSPESPLAGEHETDEEEDKQDATRELEVHLAILLINLWQARRGKLLAHPAV